MQHEVDLQTMTVAVRNGVGIIVEVCDNLKTIDCLLAFAGLKVVASCRVSRDLLFSILKSFIFDRLYCS